jgi:uncharacterized protein YeaO (DUF488 family)
MLRVKRIYGWSEKGDGCRVLVGRVWPLAISKERAHLDLWLKDIAPLDELRKWFGHDPKRRAEFAAKYRKELRSKKEIVRQLKKPEAQHGTVTPLYSAHDQEHNQAVALGEFLKGTGSS